MIERHAEPRIETALSRQAAVGLLGARQVGKTTLARRVAERRGGVVLDLEMSDDRSRLADFPRFVRANEARPVVLDEIHRMPEIFPELRGLIDEGRRRGLGLGRFLIVGSTTIPFLKQSESLAGRIEYIDLNPLSVLEAGSGLEEVNRLWLRGGLPLSLLADSDDASLAYRRDLIRAYLERDALQFRPRISPLTLDRLWTMLAHGQGGILNAAQLARSLGVSALTVVSYLDLLVGLLLVRRIPPRHAKVRKRLVKAPRVYVRDSGLLHALLGIEDLNALLGHPVAGPSWKGFVIETLLDAAPEGTRSSYYRTANGAESDLVLDLPGRTRPWAIEVKRTSAPRRTRSFTTATRDLDAEHAFVVYGGGNHFSLGENQEAVSVPEFAELLRSL